MKILKQIWKLLIEITKFIAFLIPTACIIMSVICVNNGDDLKSLWFLAMAVCFMVSDIRYKFYKTKKNKVKE